MFLYFFSFSCFFFLLVLILLLPLPQHLFPPHHQLQSFPFTVPLFLFLLLVDPSFCPRCHDRHHARFLPEGLVHHIRTSPSLAPSPSFLPSITATSLPLPSICISFSAYFFFCPHSLHCPHHSSFLFSSPLLGLLHHIRTSHYVFPYNHAPSPSFYHNNLPLVSAPLPLPSATQEAAQVRGNRTTYDQKRRQTHSLTHSLAHPVLPLSLGLLCCLCLFVSSLCSSE